MPENISRFLRLQVYRYDIGLQNGCDPNNRPKQFVNPLR